MPRRDGELAAGALDGVRVAVSVGMGHGERTGRDKLIQRNAMAIQSDVAVLRMANQQEVFADANEANGLRGGSASSVLGIFLK